jgi:Flp pilus assembly pilin Flp
MSRIGALRLIRRFWRDDEGQDIVEYALLGALIGIAAIVTWQQVAAAVGVVYTTANGGVQGLSACTPDPGGGGC